MANLTGDPESIVRTNEALAQLLSEVVQDWGHCCDNPDTCACSMGRASRLVREMHR